MIFDQEEKILNYRRVSYDIELTQRLMMEKGLPESLISRLAFGW
jgi:hypothetical protein